MRVCIGKKDGFGSVQGAEFRPNSSSHILVASLSCVQIFAILVAPGPRRRVTRAEEAVAGKGQVKESRWSKKEKAAGDEKQDKIVREPKEVPNVDPGDTMEEGMEGGTREGLRGGLGEGDASLRPEGTEEGSKGTGGGGRCEGKNDADADEEEEEEEERRPRYGKAIEGMVEGMVECWRTHEHSAQYVLTASWNCSGQMFLSADRLQILIYEIKAPSHTNSLLDGGRVDGVSTALKVERVGSMSERSVQEIFDCCWVSPQHIAIGGMDQVVVRDVLNPSSPKFVIALTDSALCKGLTAAYDPDTSSAILAIAENTNQLFFYRLSFTTLPSTLPSSSAVSSTPSGSTVSASVARKEFKVKADLLFCHSKLLQEGPRDLPLKRVAHIDLEAKLAALSFGERRTKFFGIVLDLKSILGQNKSHTQSHALSHAQPHTNTHTHDVVPNAVSVDGVGSPATASVGREYRMRGHQSRVSVVQLGNRLRRFPVRASDFFSQFAAAQADGENQDPSKKQEIRDGDQEGRQGATRDDPEQLMQERKRLGMWLGKHDDCLQGSESWPLVKRYAQVSVDGCLSVWDIFLTKSSHPAQSDEEEEDASEASAVCYFCTPSSVVDETALVTSLSWNADDDLLLLGSDDGKLTFVHIYDDSTALSPAAYGAVLDRLTTRRAHTDERHQTSRQPRKSVEISYATIEANANAAIMSPTIAGHEGEGPQSASLYGPNKSSPFVLLSRSPPST